MDFDSNRRARHEYGRKPDRKKHTPWQIAALVIAVVFVLLAMFTDSRGAASTTAKPKIALPEFAFQQVTVSVVQDDGKPVPGASIYGFCRDLNLIWPRPEKDAEWTSFWSQSYLGKTDKNGKMTAKIPAGKWAFFAAGALAGNSPKAIVVWSNFADTASHGTILLKPAKTKSWQFRLPDGSDAAAKQLSFKPTGFPVWIPVSTSTAESSWRVEMSAGSMAAWCEGDATPGKPGFVLDLGNLTSDSPDGKITPDGKTATVEFKGGDTQCAFSWSALRLFGLEGNVTLAQNAKVFISPGDFTLGYRRPVASALSASFVRQFYALKSGDDKVFDLDTPLTEALDQGVPPPSSQDADSDETTTDSIAKLYAQLYIVDGNGMLVSEIDDPAGSPAKFSATATIGGKQVAAESMPDAITVEEGGQTLFALPSSEAANPGQITWTITGPNGFLNNLRLQASTLVNAQSATFKIAVPEIVKNHALNLLAQAEIAGGTMADVTLRKRDITPTSLLMTPGHRGASATHNGTYIRIGTKLLYFESLLEHHDFIHELGHNFGFTHGGLHETSNEVTRCLDLDQISEQAAKWMFIDRMNGVTHKEVSYHNTGLYLYCYAQAGEPFLAFISTNEYAVIKALAKDYTTDEAETAVLSLALHKDMSSICQAYGLKVTPDKVAAAMDAAKPLCKTPKT